MHEDAYNIIEENKMNQETEQEKKYREEFEAIKINQHKDSCYSMDIIHQSPEGSGVYLHKFVNDQWIGYLAACKKRQEEINRLRAEKEKLRIEKTADQILWQGEIDKLKAENERLKDNALAATLPLLQSNEDEIHRLKDLVERAKPWIIERKYARALDKKDYVEELVWQRDAEKEIGG